MSQLIETQSNSCVTLPVLSVTTDRDISGPLISGSMSMPRNLRIETKRPSSEPLLVPWLVPWSWESTANLFPLREYEWVYTLREGGYRVRQPFCVQITEIGVGNFEATFPEAHIAICGIDRHDAYQALVAEILDTLDTLTEERSLIPKAAEQLQTLREYIAKEEA